MSKEVGAMPNIKQAIKEMEDYVSTYTRQHGYERFSEQTFLDDMLYGIGISISGEYRFAQGFDQFKQRLREHLKEV